MKWDNSHRTLIRTIPTDEMPFDATDSCRSGASRTAHRWRARCRPGEFPRDGSAVPRSAPASPSPPARSPRKRGQARSGRVEPPRGAADRRRSTRRQHRRVRVHQSRRPELRDVDLRTGSRSRSPTAARTSTRGPTTPNTTSRSTTTATRVADLTYTWIFTTVVRDNSREFLSNLGPVTSLDDPDLNVYQTYDLTVTDDVGNTTVLAGNGDGVHTDGDPIAAPSIAGAASMPDYTPLRNQAIVTGRTAAARRSSVRPTTRSSSTCGCSTCSTGRTRRRSARTRWPATTSTRSPCSCPSRRWR